MLMHDVVRRALVLSCLALGSGVGVSGWWRMWRFSPSVPVCLVDGQGEKLDAGMVDMNYRSTKTETIVVDVAGAVVTPGVYRLAQGSRVADALAQAGGLQLQVTDVAAVQTSLNLAAVVTDGQKIVVPQTGISLLNSQKSSDEKPITKRLVSINTATAAELQSLPGIGEKRAEDIIANRPYQSLVQLVEIKVVTQTVFAAIAELISL